MARWQCNPSVYAVGGYRSELSFWGNNAGEKSELTVFKRSLVND
jgi:hypothetical protein